MTYWLPQTEELMAKLAPFAYIAGGAARCLIMNGDAPWPADIDLFLYEAAEYSACREAVASLGYRFALETERSAAYEPRQHGELEVQIIRPFEDQWSLTYGQPAEVLSKFSFRTEQFAIWGYPLTATYVAPGAMEDTAARLLTVNNVTDPLIVAMRMLKYAQKGYGTTTMDVFKLFDAWDKRPMRFKAQVAKAQAVA